MPEYFREFTDRRWFLVCQDATAAMIEAAGPDVQFHLTLTEPEYNGFDLRTGIPVGIQQIGPMGGSLWVRSTTGAGAVRAVHNSTTALPFILSGYVVDDYVSP